jgi:hypothetical protein
MNSPIESSPIEFTPFVNGNDWCAQYIMGSYYFSQGEPDVQSEIATVTIALCMGEARRAWMHENIAGKEVVKATVSAMQDFFASDGGHHKGFDMGEVTADVKSRAGHIKQICRTPDSSTAALINLDAYIDAFTLRDIQLLLRFHSTVPARQKSEHVRFGRSLSVEHLVDQKDARHPVYNELFKIARGRIMTNGGRRNYIIDRLQELESKTALMRGVQPRDMQSLLQYSLDD